MSEDKLPNYVPVAALRRFAEQLEASTDPGLHKFLELNKQRVSSFIDKPLMRKPYNEYVPKDSVTNLRNSKYKSAIAVQDLPEFQPALGPRSRFGDGDGTFFDQWLNGDLVKTKFLYDKNGLPTMQHSAGPSMGMKQHYIMNKSIDCNESSSNSKLSTIRPYAARREDRIQREKSAAAGVFDQTAVAPTHVSETALASQVEEFWDSFDDSLNKTRSKKSGASVTGAAAGGTHTATVKLPPILSAEEKDNYFGDHARAAFFDYYRQLSRQRHTVCQVGGGGGEGSTDLEAVLNAAGDENDEEEDLEKDRQIAKMEAEYHRAISRENDDEIKLSSSNSSPHKHSHHHHHHHHSRLASLDRVDSSGTVNEETDLLKYHLKVPKKPGKIRGFSARTKFIVGCVNNDFVPRPSLIIRKEPSAILNISSQSIGDEIAVLLAHSLDGLPALEELNITDNKLRDTGLTAIIEALRNCPRVTSVNISQNKVDGMASQALFDYLSCETCNVERLIMKNADIDDIEASNFIQAIAHRNTVKELDLSGNMLGSHEVKNLILKNNSTGGESIAQLIQSPMCSVRTLKLSWNKIRSTSAVLLAKALKVNHSLTHLDLSYNGLGEAGDLLGDALHWHKHLRYLNLASSGIKPRACYTIVAGIMSCKSLVEVDLSHNPIGEVGASAVLGLADHLDQDEVRVDITGCSIRVVRDSSCWFDIRNIQTNKCKFDLGKPYDRAACMEILRTVADDEDMNFSKFAWTPTGGVEQNIELQVHSCSRSQRVNQIIEGTAPASSTSTRPGSAPNEEDDVIEPIVNEEEEANAYLEQTRHLFRDIASGKEGLERDEVGRMLKLLGMDNSKSVVDQLMATYDADGSGVIEEAEFVEFIIAVRKNAKRLKERVTQIRYFTLKTDTPLPMSPNSNKRPKAYLPPDDGVVECKVQVQRVVPEFMTAVLPTHVESLLQTSKTVADSGAMIDYALKSMRVKYDEALSLYRIMMKESGDKLKVLQRLLPRMATPGDARSLIAQTCADSVKDVLRIKACLGQYYRICTGMATSYYVLNLSHDMDKLCLERLAEISSAYAIQRQRSELGDTSQHGDWSGFRNALLDGTPIIVTPEFLTENRPTQGRLEFDFVTLLATNMTEQVLSDIRVFKLMSSLGMVHEDSKSIVLTKIAKARDMGEASSKGLGSYEWKMGLMAGHEAGQYLNTIYGSASMAGRFASSNMILSSHVMSLDEQAAQEIVVASSTGSPNIASAVDIFSSHINQLRCAANVDESLITMRIVDAIQFSLGGRFMSCAQLSMLMEKLPGGDAKVNNFTTWRVELAVGLFPQLVDLINFECILKIVKPIEHGMLMFRLGWLNVWNPIKPDGCMMLNLARREERQVIRILIALSIIEPGENWLDETFQVTFDEVAAPGWELPITFTNEVGLPDIGIITLRYFSGNGIGANNCQPDLVARIALMALVLAQPYAAEVKLTYKPTLDRAEIVTTNSGCKLFYSTQKQIAARGKKPEKADKKK